LRIKDLTAAVESVEHFIFQIGIGLL